MLRIRPTCRDVNVPPGGWADVEPQMNVIVTAASLMELVSAEARLLTKNGKKVPEDHALQVELRIAARLPPDWVYDTEDPDSMNSNTGGLTEAKALNNSQKAVKTAQRLDCKKVNAEEANRRAQICVQCNRKRFFGCLTCTGTHAKLERLMGTMKTPYDGAVGACELDLIFNRTQIWLPREFFLGMIPTGARFKTQRYPETCWKRQLLENENANGDK